MKRPNRIQVWALCPALVSSLFLAVLNPSLAPAQTEPVMTGMQLWLKADAGVTATDSGAVMGWKDQSGMLNNAVQLDETRAPRLVTGALNGNPVIRFDGTDDYLEVFTAPSLEITGDISSFAVVRFDDFANYRSVWAKSQGNLPAPTDWYMNMGTGVPTVYRGDGSSYANVSANQEMRAGEYLVLGFSMAGSTLTHYLNGYPIGRGELTVPVADGGTSLMVGSRYDFFTNMKGDIAELFVYNTALEEPDRNAVFNYLQSKYNLRNLSPAVSISSPADNVTFKAPTNFVVTVKAADPDGTIAKVEFYGNGGLLATAMAPPYSLPIRVSTAGALVLTAVAWDNKDARVTSTPITVNVTAEETSTYVPGSNLQLWLKADVGVTAMDSGAVMGWKDQSGMLNNAVQLDETMAPVLVTDALHGNPVIRFDGTDDYLEVFTAPSLEITGDISSFAVVRFDDFANYRSVWAKSQGNLPAPTDWYMNMGTGVPTVYRGNGSSYANVSANQAMRAGEYLVLGFSMAGSTLTHYLNGYPIGSGELTAPVADGGTSLMVGSRYDFLTKMKGDLAELLIFNTAAEGQDQVAIAKYLGDKYGILVIQAANQAPEVSLTEPVDGARLPSPENIIFEANATDADGSIVRMDLYIDGKWVSTSTNGTLTVSQTLPWAGEFTCAVVATDNLGARKQSAPVRFCIAGEPGPAGLTGYWPLDGDAKAVVDRDGSLVNAPIPTEDRNGKPNGALLFDNAQQQRVEIPGGGSLNGLTQGTISLWAKWTGPQVAGYGGAYGAVLGRMYNGQWADTIINLSDSDPGIAVIEWRQANPTMWDVTGAASVGNGIWHHIAVTFAPEVSELFMDGVSQGKTTSPAPGLHTGPNVPLTIGAWIGDGNSYATAAVDDVAIWGRPLRAEQIQALAAQTKTPLNVEVTNGCQSSLAIRLEGNDVIITWTGPGVLESAATCSGPWAEVQNATSPYQVQPQGSQYYRLR